MSANNIGQMNWKEVWERKRQLRVRPDIPERLDQIFGPEIAADYARRNRANGYEYGRKAIEAMQGVIGPDFEGEHQEKCFGQVTRGSL